MSEPGRGQVAAAALEALTGLTDRRHRQLAKAGYFPPPVRGVYELAPTLRGLFRYYREAAHGGAALRERKMEEEIRGRKLRNDNYAGRLVERAWVAERIQRAAGELHAFRAKSEMEHPMRFAAAAGDVPMCRTVLRGVWDEVFKGIQSLEKHFSE